MTATTDHVRLLPVHFANFDDRSLVFLIDPARIDWRPGFFRRGLPTERPFDAMRNFDAWLHDGGETARDFSHTGLIFHVSRCGSTLLSQNLKATGEAVVLSEPSFFRIPRTLSDGTIDRATAIAAVARVIGAWQDWAASRSQRLVIKLNSQMHEWIDDLLAALPGAQAIALHREPAPVLESLARGTPGYLRDERLRQRHQPDEALAEATADPVLLAAAQRYCSALDTFAAAGQQLAKVAYPDLADAFPGICQRFGLSPEAANWNGAIDAKARRPDEAAPYRPVGEDRLASFRADNHALLALLEARYRDFRESLARTGQAQGEAIA